MSNKKKAIIIVPAYNEEKNIQNVIQDILSKSKNFDYIVINDCSTDNTENLCELKKYNFINLPVNLGIGSAVQTGYLYAKKNGYEYAVQFDGDGQHDAIYLETMFSEIEKKEYSMIIGSRFIEKKGFQSSEVRRLGIKMLSKLIKIIWKKEIRDITSGFRIIDSNLIDEFSKYYPPDYPEPESIGYCLRKGYKIKEIPVVMHERKEGKSSINYIRAIYYMIKVSLSIIIEKYKI